MNTQPDTMPLCSAERGIPLEVASIDDIELAARLYQVGLFEGSRIQRLDEEVSIRPVRVRNDSREAVFGGGMTMNIIVHIDDGRRLPLAELKSGESGHIEGVTRGGLLAEFMETLGFRPDTPITFLRSLPPMEYVTVTERGERVRLTEGMASKIWGTLDERPMQFASASAGKPFRVLRIFGNQASMRNFPESGILAGSVITLESVCQAQSFDMGGLRCSASPRKPVIISGVDGLRLYLEREDSLKIRVLPL